MKTLEKGVYTAKPDSKCSEAELHRRLELMGEIRSRMAELNKKSDAESYNAEKDIMAIRARTRIDPETGKPYIP